MTTRNRCSASRASKLRCHVTKPSLWTTGYSRYSPTTDGSRPTAHGPVVGYEWQGSVKRKVLYWGRAWLACHTNLLDVPAWDMWNRPTWGHDKPTATLASTYPQSPCHSLCRIEVLPTHAYTKRCPCYPPR